MFAQDTEFPGVVARPIGSFRGSSDYHYQTLRCNVDLLRIIQLGITLCDENGELAPGVCTWQFNFQFSIKCVRSVGGLGRLAAGGTLCPRQDSLSALFARERTLTSHASRSDDMYAPESIELLTKSGINFKRHEEYGISVEEFGELLISSGLVLLDEVQWVSFHRCVDVPTDSACSLVET